MKRQTMANLLLELARRLHYNYHGTYKGFGKFATHFRRTWRLNFNNDTLTAQGLKSYKDVWNSDIMLEIRKSVGM